VSDWQPIETAPKDGTLILLSAERRPWLVNSFKAKFDEGSGRWLREFGKDDWAPFSGTPRNWMPLPPPPKDIQG